MAQTIKRFMALYDIHVGTDKRLVDGRMKSELTHSLPAIKAVMDFAVDFKPDWLILGGDQLNCGPVSHWNAGKPRLMPDMNLKWEMDELDKLILKPFDAIIPASGRKVWKSGNHEQWINQFVNENPGVEGLCEPENYLKLRERGWELAGDEDIIQFGKINFIHGHEVFKRGTVLAGSGAKKMGNAYRRNIRAGHLHTYEVYTDITPVDRSDYHTSIILPAMARASQAYAGGSSSNFQQGFGFGYVMPDGNFSDYVSIINNGKFVWNGRIYGR
jgi:Calcineurin-like phosphoesterase